MSYVARLNPTWNVVPFGKVVQRSQYGLSKPSTPTGIPYLKMSNIQDGKIVLEGADLLEVDDATLREYCLRGGDLIFNRTNSLDLVGKSGVYNDNDPAVFASYLVRFQLHPDKADSRFVALWFGSAGASHRLRCLATPGVSQSNINPTTLRRAMLVPCPPVAEQRKIADMLGTWDEALEKLDALISAKERRKQALMQQLLTGRKRLKGFTQPWSRHRFSEILDPEDRYVEFEDAHTYPLVSIRRRSGGVFYRGAIKGSDIKTKILKRVHSGDFLISRMQVVHGALGMVHPHCDGMYASDSYDVLVAKDVSRLHMPFLDWMSRLRSFWHLTYISSHGVHIEKMTFKLSDFMHEKIALPSDNEEQRRIAAILDTAGEELTLLRAQLAALEQQKRGLMQRLLTGAIRVKS